MGEFIMRTRNIDGHVSALALASLLMASPAFAQETTPPVPASVDDIVVTARRVEEGIQSTPVSITAINGEGLRDAGIRSTIDLMVKTPGVYLGGSGGRENSTFQIRGQSKARNGSNPPAVISYFADVPQPTFGSGVATYDLASVQVLKGPQGTLFGRNTTGGAVLFYPVLPGYTLDGYVEGTYGSYDRRQVEAAISIPLIDDKVAIRLAGQYNKADGYSRNVLTGGDLDNVNSRAVRATLLLEPAAGIKNVTIFDFYRNYYNGEASVVTGLRAFSPLLDPRALRAAAQAALDRQNARGPRRVESDSPPLNRSRRLGVTNRTDIDITDDISVTNIFGYRRTYVAYNINTDSMGALVSTGNAATPAGTAYTVLNGGAINHVEQFSDELQLKGEAFGVVDWLVGGFYLHSSPNGSNGVGSKTLQVANPAVNLAFFGYNFYTEESRALFANANVDLGSLVEGLHFNAGARYTWDKVKACTASDVTTGGALGPDACTDGDPRLLLPSTNRTRSKAPTWQVGLDWQATPDLFAYVVSRHGYRAGGINSPTLGGTLAPFQGYDPEKVTDLEVGFRSDWDIGRGGHFRLNASAFVAWGKDATTSLSAIRTGVGCVAGDPVFGAPPFSPDGDCNPNNDPTSGSLTVNAGKTRVRGIDVDGFLSLGSAFRFTFAGNLLDPKSTGFSVPAAVRPYAPTGAIGFDFVAKETYSLGAEYRLPLHTLGELTARMDYYHSSKLSFIDAFLPAYGIFNARLDLEGVGGRPIDISVFATNLFDKDYQQVGIVNGPGAGFSGAIFGPPRQIGVSLRYRIGG
jgi:iron complex outermembrane receptor protein